MIKQEGHRKYWARIQNGITRCSQISYRDNTIGGLATSNKVLIEKGYFCETITVQGKGDSQTKGLVFAYPDQLQTLTNCGLLTIFDSTYKFNVHSYNLFTFMCHNKAAIWVPGANCLVETENSNILAVALRTIYEWSGF